MKKLICVFVLLTGWNVFGQVIPNKDKVKLLFTGGSPVTGLASKIERLTGNIISCGFMNTVSNGKDAALVKLDSNLNQIWFVQFDSLGLDEKFNDTYINPTNGDIYVTGFVKVASGNKNVVAAKYNSSGILQWRVYGAGNANLDDEGNSIAFDGTNVWITGYVSVTGKGKDLFVWKISGSTGTSLAQPRRNGTANGDDIGYKICISGTSAFVTGYTSNTSTNKDIYVACFNLSTAALTWSTSTNGSASGDDSGLDALYNLGDLYVCGYKNQSTTGDDYYFARINVSNGSIKYSDTYDAGWNGSDQATSMVSTKTGFYGVTGLATDGSSNNYYNTRMYDTSNVYWTHSQPINGSYTLMNPKISVDTIAWHFYCAGTYSNSTLDGLLYQLDPTGVKRWTQYHNGVNNAGDGFIDLVVDGLARIFVASPNETGTGTGIYDYKLIRYSQTPVYMPVNYNMASDTFSMAHLFYPNNGQIKDTSGTTVDAVLYYANFGSPRDYILQNKIAYCETKRDSFGLATRKDSLSRVDMIFDGANEFSEIFAIDYQNEAILNYFIADTIGITNIKGSSHLICPNIYPMIDLHYSSNEKGSKYYFVVKPTGDPNAIRLRFDGAVSTATVSNELVITSEFSTWKFKKPDIYYVSVPSWTNLTLSTTSVTGTNGWVNLGSDTYSINPGTYNTAWPLIIEIDMGKSSAITSASDNMTWSTYFGSTTTDVGWSVVNDNSNNIYIGGYTGAATFPTTPGAYQTVYATGDPNNGFITKFYPNRSMAWSTYYGGTDDEEVKALEFDNTNSRLYAVGYTFSTDFPLKNKSGATTSPSFHGSGNSADGFVVDLNPSNGQPSWSYLLGANGDDRAIDVKLDGSGNKYIACNAQTGITTINPGSAYMQSTYNGGFSDGMLYKFTSSDVTSWVTYYGGSNTDYLHSVGVDASNSVYLMGHTNSTNLSTLSSGQAGEIYQASNGGGFDWFFVKFNSSGQRLWATYYGGTGDEYATQERGITTIGNEAYFYGMTASSGLTTQQYASSTIQTFAGNNDTYILAINTNYNPIWATYLGGTDVDYAGGITKDGSGNIYVNGSSFSSNFPYSIPPTYYGQVFQGSTHGSATWIPEGGDAFVAAYSTARNLVWSTWVGGNGIFTPSGDDLAYGISVSSNNNLYITGGTSSRSPYYPSFNPGIPAYYSSPTTGFGSGDVIISEFNVASLPLVGINENKLQNNSYIVYPNPTQNFVYVLNTSPKSKIEVFDIKGSKIKFLNSNGGKEEINIENFTNGIYFIKITDKNGLYETHKIIKVE